MGYQFWDGIPRTPDDATRIAAFVAAELAKQDELSELGDVNIPAPADGEVLTYDTGTSKWIAAAGGDGAADFPMKLKPTGTRYVQPGWYSADRAWSVAGAGVIYYIPIFVSETTTYIRISIYVHIGFAGTADLRIFNWDSGVPGSLVLSAGTVNTTPAGAKDIVISQELTRGFYFLAIRCSGSGNIRAHDIYSSVAPAVAGFLSYLEGRLPFVVLKVTDSYADPAPAPTGADFAYCAYVFLREN